MGHQHAAVKTGTGEVWVWGSGARGQLGLGITSVRGTSLPSKMPLPPSSAGSVIKVTHLPLSRPFPPEVYYVMRFPVSFFRRFCVELLTLSFSLRLAKCLFVVLPVLASLASGLFRLMSHLPL
jgi:hypothetical protein